MYIIYNKIIICKNSGDAFGLIQYIEISIKQININNDTKYADWNLKIPSAR